jgi:hypothetical protein
LLTNLSWQLFVAIFFLEAGGSQIIMAFSDQGWLKLTYNNPALAGMINRVNMVEVNSEEAIHVAQDQILILEGRLKVRYLYQTIKSSVELAERFIQDEAKPGKVIKLLEYAATYAQDGWVTKESVQDAVEKNYGVRIKTALGGETSGTQNEAEALLNMEALIHERMINQSRAVKIVSDALWFWAPATFHPSTQATLRDRLNCQTDKFSSALLNTTLAQSSGQMKLLVSFDQEPDNEAIGRFAAAGIQLYPESWVMDYLVGESSNEHLCSLADDHNVTFIDIVPSS